LIATVNPRAECANDTISTLEFASRAKMIKLSAKLNEDEYHRLSTGAQSAESMEQLLKLREEVSALDSENEELRNEIVALQRSEIEMEQTLLHQQASMYKQEQELAKITSLRDEIESREFALAEENCALQDRLSQLEKVVETLTRTINAQTQAQISPRQPTPPAAIVISSAPTPLPASPMPNRANVSSTPTPAPKNDKKVPVPTVSEIFRQYDSDGDSDVLRGDDYEEDEEDDEGRQSDAEDNLGQDLEQKEAQIQELVARVSNLTNQLSTQPTCFSPIIGSQFC
jgi:chromosome segregation ATPase